MFTIASITRGRSCIRTGLIDRCLECKTADVRSLKLSGWKISLNETASYKAMAILKYRGTLLTVSLSYVTFCLL